MTTPKKSSKPFLYLLGAITLALVVILISMSAVSRQNLKTTVVGTAPDPTQTQAPPSQQQNCCRNVTSKFYLNHATTGNGINEYYAIKAATELATQYFDNACSLFLTLRRIVDEQGLACAPMQLCENDDPTGKLGALKTLSCSGPTNTTIGGNPAVEVTCNFQAKCNLVLPCKDTLEADDTTDISESCLETLHTNYSPKYNVTGPAVSFEPGEEEAAKEQAKHNAYMQVHGYFDRKCQAYKPSLNCDSTNCKKAEQEVDCGLTETSYYYEQPFKVPGVNQYYSKLTCAFASCSCSQECLHKEHGTPSPIQSSPSPSGSSGHLPFTSIMQSSLPESYPDSDPTTEDTTYSDSYPSSDEGDTTYTYP
jgi:hypothetical protein